MKIMTEECPKCGSDELEADYLNCDETTAWRTITCPRCKFMYNEVFTFSHNEDIVTCAELEF